MKRETICLIIACLISFILTAGIMNWRMEIVHAELSDTQQSLAKEVFRIIPGESGGDHLLFSGQTVWRYHFSRGKLRSTENCTWEGKWT